MKKTVVIVLGVFLLSATGVTGQDKFYTKNGKVSFFSSTPMENIEANNKTAVALLNSKTGELRVATLLKGFEFKKALMQEHFNSDYVESDKFPKSEFEGLIVNNNEINYTANGTYTAKVKGKLTLHGITNDVETTGSVIIKDGKVHTNSIFTILLADYKISIPADVRNSISNTIKITVDCGLDPLKS
ncbi:MAG: YceI family protein [Bacteroidetes bacterium]|nr:YceI family protein [Bacteroidota bacterium]